MGKQEKRTAADKIERALKESKPERKERMESARRTGERRGKDTTGGRNAEKEVNDSGRRSGNLTDKG